tara:strand:+ start:5984 stop:7267 length:1284 start_codon:yes stop_codon:yes gene_type:complete
MWVALLFSACMLAITVVLLRSTRLQQKLEISFQLSIASLAIKLLAAAFLWALYTYYYTDRSAADMYKYFDDALAIKKGATELNIPIADFFNPFQERTSQHQLALHNTQHWDLAKVQLMNDNRTMSRIHLLLLPLSKGHFWVHQLFFCLLAFWGSILLYLFFKWNDIQSKSVLFVLFMLFPSTLLWTSGALKEAFLFFALGGFLFFTQALFSTFSIKKLGFSLFFLILLANIKLYVGLLVLPAGLLLFSLLKLKVKNYGAITFIGTVVIGAVLLFFQKDQFLQAFQTKLFDFTQTAISAKAGSYFEIPSYSTIGELLAHFPKAIYNVFLRPIFPAQINFFSLISALEHFLLIALFVLAIIHRKAFSHQSKQIAYFCFLFILPISLLIGSTVPVLGAIVRYKVILLPFYFYLLLTFVDLKRIPILKKIS